MADFRGAGEVMRAAVAGRVFPGAAVEVGDASRPIWQDAVGALTYAADAPPVQPDTVYDLASLTKVMATATVAMRAVEQGLLGLDDPVAEHVSEWLAPDRQEVTLRDLLSHCSGLAAHAPLFRGHSGEPSFRRAICDSPLEYLPRSRSIYSDLGFMLLGFVLSRRRTLSQLFDSFWALTGPGEDLQFLPPTSWHHRTAPTEVDPWRGRLLIGEVQDENCWALGGVAGHAGLFGTASAVGTYARHVLQVLDGRRGAFSRATVEEFIRRRGEIPHSSRALGWDTMLPTSSCGTRMSKRAFGHTGFTGTSLWIDPEAGCYVVMLSNRVHPTRTGEGISVVRPAFHDAVMTALGY